MADPMATAESRAEHCKAMLGSIQMYGNAGELTMADRFYGGICNTCKEFPAESALRGLLAAGADAMAFYHGRSGQLDEAAGFIDDLRALCTDYPAEEPQWRFLSDALSTQALNHGMRGEWDAVEELYRELRQLASWVPDHAFIQEKFATTAYNHSVGLLSAGKVEEVFGIFHELRALSVRVPDSGEIRSSLARLGINLSASVLQAGLEKTQALCKELRLMVEAHPSEAELRVLATMAIGNVATALAHSERISASIELYCVIARWAEQNPDVRELREQRARTARNIILLGENVWKVEQAWKLFQEIAAVVTADPESDTIREWCAESARTFWNKAVALGDRGHAEMGFLILAGLANRYPADSHLREAVEAIRPARERLTRAPSSN